MADKERKAFEAAHGGAEAANNIDKISKESLLKRIDNLGTLDKKQRALNDAIQSEASIRQQMEAVRNAAAPLETGVDLTVSRTTKGNVDVLAARAKDLAQAASDELEHGVTLADYQVKVNETALDIAKEKLEVNKKESQDKIEAIKLADRELKTAKEALKTEQDKDASLRAGIGALNRGEQKKLGRLLDSADKGTLTRKQAVDLQKVGGDVGGDIAKHFLKAMDHGLGGREEKLRAKLTGHDPLKDVQADFEKRQKSFKTVAGNQSADEAVQSVEGLSKQFADGIDKATDVIRDRLEYLYSEIGQLKMQQERVRSAAVSAKAVAGR